MCYTVISHLHSFWSDHHKSSHLSPCKVITILLTLFLLLHSTSLWLIYFTPENLYRLISLTYFTPSHPPPLWQPPVWTLYLSVCFYFVMLACFFLPFWDSTCSKMKWYLSVSVWLIPLSHNVLRCIHVTANCRSFLYDWIIHFIMCIYASSSLSIYLPVDT